MVTFVSVPDHVPSVNSGVDIHTVTLDRFM